MQNGAYPFPASLYPRAFASSATDQSALAALPPTPFRLAVPCCGAGLGTLPASVLSRRRAALPEAAPVRRRRAQRLAAPRAACPSVSGVQPLGTLPMSFILSLVASLWSLTLASVLNLLQMQQRHRSVRPGDVCGDVCQGCRCLAGLENGYKNKNV